MLAITLQSKEKEEKKGKNLLHSSPTFRSHPFLNCRPYILHNPSIPPPPTAAHIRGLLIPAVDSKAAHATAPPSHFTGYFLATPPDIDARRVLEQLGRGRPFVRLELPCLTSGEYRDNAVPVVGLEIGGAVDEDEDRGFAGCGRVDGAACCDGGGLGGVWNGAESARDLEEVGAGGFGEGRVVWGNVDAVGEEGFDV